MVSSTPGRSTTVPGTMNPPQPTPGWELSLLHAARATANTATPMVTPTKLFITALRLVRGLSPPNYAWRAGVTRSIRRPAGSGCRAPREQPRERDLLHRNTAILRDVLHDVDDLPIHVGVDSFRVRVVLRSNAGTLLLGAWPRELAASERRPRDDADAFGAAERNHLTLFLAIEQVVLRLHGDESRPAVALGDAEGAHQLPGKP